MNYGRVNEPVERHNFADACGEKSAFIPGDSFSGIPLAGVMAETQSLGRDIMVMVDKIGFSLYGRSGIALCEEKVANPTCHMEALMLHRESLVNAAEALSKICVMLGV